MTARGRLTLLSAAERPYCEALLRGFARRHPAVEVDFVFGISTALHDRYLAEHAAGGPTADLIWSSAMDQVMGLVLEGHAQPHGVAHGLPAEAAWQDLALATTREPVFSLTRGPGRAGSFAEIAAFLAAHPGPVGVPDIEANGLGFLALLRASQVDPGFATGLAALGARRPRLCGSAPALVRAVAEGGVLAVHVLGAYALRAVAADPSLAIAESDLPAPAVARLAFIPARAANPEAASAFLAFLVSEEGQAALAEGDFWPVLATPPRRIAPIPLDADFPALLDPGRRAALVTSWRAAMTA